MSPMTGRDASASGIQRASPLARSDYATKRSAVVYVRDVPYLKTVFHGRGWRGCYWDEKRMLLRGKREVKGMLLGGIWGVKVMKIPLCFLITSFLLPFNFRFASFYANLNCLASSLLPLQFPIPSFPLPRGHCRRNPVFQQGTLRMYTAPLRDLYNPVVPKGLPFESRRLTALYRREETISL